MILEWIPHRFCDAFDAHRVHLGYHQPIEYHSKWTRQAHVSTNPLCVRAAVLMRKHASDTPSPRRHTRMAHSTRLWLRAKPALVSYVIIDLASKSIHHPLVCTVPSTLTSIKRIECTATSTLRASPCARGLRLLMGHVAIHLNSCLG